MPTWRVGVLIGLVASICLGCGTLSVQEEKRLGHEAQRQVRSQFQMLRDPVIVNYVRRLGAELVRSAQPSPFEFRFFVVEDEEINAFALPGGAIYVHTGVLLKARDSSEVAGVLAHEIAHVTERHVANLYRRQRNTGIGAQFLTIAVAILTGNPYITNASSIVGGAAAAAYLGTFTRDAEREADARAVETLLRANYDPNGMVDFFETLRRETAGGLKMPQFLSSHPATVERIANVASMIKAHHPLPPGLRQSDGKLEIIQERIRLVTGTDVESVATPDPSKN